MYAQQIIAIQPDVRGETNDALIKCIEECYSCAQTCTTCADACVAEETVAELRQCIRLNVDCADVCAGTGSMSSRRTGGNVELLDSVIQACAIGCRRCGDECGRHAPMHEHCRICAEACRRCEQACKPALSLLSAAA